MIMRYYKYPERGTGNYSYTTETHQFPVEFDFGNTPFDWDNMLPAYNYGEYNETQANAVATTDESLRRGPHKWTMPRHRTPPVRSSCKAW